MMETPSASQTTQALLSKLGGIAELDATAVAELRRHDGQPIAVAVSGGPDSVAAAMVARELHKGPLTLLHFNHHLRAEASDGDENFVRELAKNIGADYRVGHWESPSAKNEGAARDARMAWLHGWEYPAIVYGHHADDAVETILMRLARGSGIEGLVAPHAANTVGAHTHIRPLLTLRKAKIVEALEALNISYRTDATNAENDYLRNRIRNELLPMWQKIETKDVAAGILASRENLKEVWEKNPTESFLAGEVAADVIPAVPYHATTVPMGGTLYIPIGAIGGVPVTASISVHLVPTPTLAQLKEQTCPAGRVWVRPCATLVVRPWEAGERYTPHAAPGSRKIKEILNATPIAADLDGDLRRLWPVVCDGATGVPLWLPGARVAAASAMDLHAPYACELRFEITSPSVSLNDI